MNEIKKENALLIDAKDNVAVALSKLEAGDRAVYLIPGTDQYCVTVIKETIPIYHKFSIREIRKNGEILKYGETIGTANSVIEEGRHVHLHNVLDKRGQLVLEGRA